MNFMLKIRSVALSLVLLVGLIQLRAQATVFVDLQRNSTLTIHGSTNIVPFKLVQSGDKLAQKNLYVSYSKNQNKISTTQTELQLMVKNFNSDNKLAQRDFRKLVKADVYPTMLIALQSLELSAEADKNNCFAGVANMKVTITGVSRPYTVPVSLNSEGDLYNVDGKKRLNIRDFGLTPPVEMMGLIRVNEWIDIDFHLICKIKSDYSAKR